MVMVPEVKVPDHVPEELVVLDEPLTLQLFDDSILTQVVYLVPLMVTEPLEVE